MGFYKHTINDLGQPRSPILGNICTVDAVNGNDATGARGGLPFRSPEAALASAASGDVVWILPGSYTLTTGITVPDGVNISGLNHGAPILLNLAVAADTVLLTMGENSVVENITLSLTSAGHYALTGVLFPGTTAATSSLESVTVSVDNSGASDIGTSNVYGVRSTGTGSNTFVDAVRDGSINIKSAGLGSKRGVLVDTGAATFSLRNVVVDVSRTGAGLGTYIGCESNFAGCSLIFRVGTVSGFTADISQLLGVLTLGTGSFLNHTANGKGFSTIARQPQLDWGDPGMVGTGTFFMYRGTYQSSIAVEPKTRLSAVSCLSNLVIRAATGPGDARVDTWTIRINGVDTALVATLTGAQTSAVITGISITAQAGDDVSLKMVTVAGSTTANVQATCNFV